MVSDAQAVQWLLYGGAFGLVVIGVFGLLALNNAFRLLLALIILESGANLLLVLSGFREQGMAPIILSTQAQAGIMNDPVPQALVLTAIVIGVGVQALALTLILRVKQRYQTLDMRQIKALMEKDISEQHQVAHLSSYESPAQISAGRESDKA